MHAAATTEAPPPLRAPFVAALRPGALLLSVHHAGSLESRPFPLLQLCEQRRLPVVIAPSPSPPSDDDAAQSMALLSIHRRLASADGAGGLDGTHDYCEGGRALRNDGTALRRLAAAIAAAADDDALQSTLLSAVNHVATCGAEVRARAFRRSHFRFPKPQFVMRLHQPLTRAPPVCAPPPRRTWLHPSRAARADSASAAVAWWRRRGGVPPPSLSLHSLTGSSHASSGSRDDALRSHALAPASGACLLLSALASAPGGGEALLEINAAVSLGEAVARRGLPVALRAAAANALGEADARSTQKGGAAAVEAAAGRALRAMAAAEGAEGVAMRAALNALDAARG